MLEVRRVVHARGQEHDGRIRDPGRRGRAQHLEQPRRIVGNRAHAVRREQFREHVRHRAAVLDDVRDAGRCAEIVLEHAEVAVSVADEVDARDVHAHAARRFDAGDRAVEVLRGDDEPTRHDPVVQDRAAAVHVGEEGFERLHALARRRVRSSTTPPPR